RRLLREGQALTVERGRRRDSEASRRKAGDRVQLQQRHLHQRDGQIPDGAAGGRYRAGKGRPRSCRSGLQAGAERARSVVRLQEEVLTLLPSGRRWSAALSLEPLERSAARGHAGGMRPSLLNPLFAPVRMLPGVGPQLEKHYRRLFGRPEGARLVDLLFHLPAGVVDRRARPKLRDVVFDSVVTVAVTVDRHHGPGRSRAPYQIFTSDETGDLIIVYFNARDEYLQKQFPVGARVVVSGAVALYDGMLQMVHPDRVVSEADLAKLPLLDPVYPLTEGLGAGHLRRAMDAALGKLPPLPEWQDAGWLKARGYPPFAEALGRVHRPEQPDDVLPEGTAWSRLAYDEVLAGQLALTLVRAHVRRQAGRGSAGDGSLRARILKALPYSLTPSQRRAVDEIVADLARPQRMLRLLQGDVGAGKTVV